MAQSDFHDIVSANELGIPSLWLNHLGERSERGDGAPTREPPDLTGLADALDGLVPQRR